MNNLISTFAQYLLFVVLAAATVFWLSLPGRDKVGLAVQAIASLVLVVVLIKVAATLYTDPRPFVADPSIRPLFAHSADNGFPSDHTAVAATVAFLVMIYHRWFGAGLLAASLVLGASRIAAHVHHVPDIVAGVLIAALAVALASVIWRSVRPRLPQRLTQRASG